MGVRKALKILPNASRMARAGNGSTPVSHHITTRLRKVYENVDPAKFRKLCSAFPQLVDLYRRVVTDLLDKQSISQSNTVPSSKCAEELSQVPLGSTPIVVQHAGGQGPLNVGRGGRVLTSTEAIGLQG